MYICICVCVEYIKAYIRFCAKTFLIYIRLFTHDNIFFNSGQPTHTCTQLGAYYIFFEKAEEFPLNKISQLNLLKTKIKIVLNNFNFYCITITLIFTTFMK